METALIRLALAALTHGLPADIALPADDAPLRAAFHAVNTPDGCSPEDAFLARHAHRAAQAHTSEPDANHLRGVLQALWARLDLGQPVSVVPRAYTATSAPSVRTGGDPRHRRESLLPVQQAEPPAADFWQQCGQALRQALGTGQPDSAAVVRVLGAQRRWTWAVPAHEPDESLFEHLHLTAATITALWYQHPIHETGEEQPICLALIDLSGIQRYLFATTSGGAGGIARRLRARSLTLSMVAEALAHQLLDALGLPLCNLLATSGGHCYLLLPNTPTALATLQQTWQILELHLRRRYGSTLAATLAWQPLAVTDLAHAGPALHRLAARRSAAKARPLAALLQEGDRWREDVWVSEERFAGRSVCIACGTRPATTTVRDDAVCPACAADYHLGAALPSARFLGWSRVIGDQPLSDGQIRILDGVAIQAVRRLDDLGGSPYLVLQVNAFDSLDTPLPVMGRYLATHVPVHDDAAPMDFTAMSARATGAALLAVVKADVDRLGQLFAWGLRRDDSTGADSLSRTLSISRLIDTFFSGWVHGLLVEQFPHCYTIYSGGDDMLLVGPWDQALRLLDRLQQDFRRYTSHPHITISAGAALIRPQTPISDAVALADAQESLAKEQGSDGGRDQVALFNLALPWSRAAFVWQRWQSLASSPERAPSSALHRWLGYTLAYRSGEGGAGLRAVTHFAYDFARNKRELPQPYRDEWHRILSAIFDGQGPETMVDAELLARLLILGQRSRA